MALHLVSLGAGEHRVSTEGWQQVLGATARGYPKRASIATHIQELVFSGWLRRREGGSGSPYYAVALPPPPGTPAVFPPPSGDGRAETAPIPSGDGRASPIPSGDVFPSPPGTGASSLLLLPSSSSSSSNARARKVHPDALAVIDHAGDVLNGCRGSLRDYLAERVDPDRQHAYVQRVVTALQGADEWMWKDRAGHTLHEGRTKILAAALNELLAGDETGKHFPEPPGGYGNLRSKVRYLVASSLGTDRDVHNATGTDGPPRRRPRSDISNQGSLD